MDSNSDTECPRRRCELLKGVRHAAFDHGTSRRSSHSHGHCRLTHRREMQCSMDIDGDVQRGKGGSAVQREDPLSVPPCPLGCDFRISQLWPGGVQAQPLDAEPSKESAGGQGHNHPSQRGEPRVQASAVSAILHPDTVQARRESS